MGLLFADVRVEDALYRHFAFFDKNFFFFIVSYIVLNLAIFLWKMFSMKEDQWNFLNSIHIQVFIYVQEVKRNIILKIIVVKKNI